MNLKACWDWLCHRPPEPEMPDLCASVTAAVKQAWNTGHAIGYLQGRTDALTELEADLALRGKAPADFEMTDLKAARTKLVH
jgi:hypothetical protein